MYQLTANNPNIGDGSSIVRSKNLTVIFLLFFFLLPVMLSSRLFKSAPSPPTTPSSSGDFEVFRSDALGSRGHRGHSIPPLIITRAPFPAAPARRPRAASAGEAAMRGGGRTKVPRTSAPLVCAAPARLPSGPPARARRFPHMQAPVHAARRDARSRAGQKGML